MHHVLLGRLILGMQLISSRLPLSSCLTLLAAPALPPCPQIKSSISEPALRFALYEPVEFIRHFLVDKLEFTKVGGQ